MATSAGSSVSKQAGYRSFVKHLKELETAIQDPGGLATDIYSHGLIDRVTRQRASLPSASTLERNRDLLEKLESQIESNASAFDTLLSILDKDPTTKDIHDQLKSTRDSEIAQPTMSTPPTPYNNIDEIKMYIKLLEEKFDKVKDLVLDLLQSHCIDVKKVVHKLTSLPASEMDQHEAYFDKNLEKLEHCGEHWKLFSRLNLYWNYLSPQLLYHLINTFLPTTEAKRKMVSYDESLGGFRCSTLLSLFCELEGKEKEPPVGFSQIVVKFEISRSTTLEHLEYFRIKFARHYRLRDFALMLSSKVTSGSFVATFCVPNSIVDRLRGDISSAKFIFKEFSVTHVEIGGKSTYQLDAPLQTTTPTTSSPKALQKEELGPSERHYLSRILLPFKIMGNSPHKAVLAEIPYCSSIEYPSKRLSNAILTRPNDVLNGIHSYRRMLAGASIYKVVHNHVDREFLRDLGTKLKSLLGAEVNHLLAFTTLFRTLQGWNITSDCVEQIDIIAQNGTIYIYYLFKCAESTEKYDFAFCYLKHPKRLTDDEMIGALISEGLIGKDSTSQNFYIRF